LTPGPESKPKQIKEWFTEFSEGEGEKYEGTSVATCMYYLKERKTSQPRYCGAGEPPEPIDYVKVVQFKSDMSKLSTLPERTKLQMIQYYRDWLQYLFNNVKHLQKDWSQHWKRRQVVIVVPNSWDYDQRILLKDAIVKAGWVERESNIKFLRECEATLNCLVEKKDVWQPQEVGLYFSWYYSPSLTINPVQVGKAFVVLDAGHINFDVGLFYVKSKSPLQFREKAGKPPESKLFL
jgi:hypothetical protein